MNSDRANSAVLSAVVPAAGMGSRMKADTPKQFIGINGKSILSHTLDRLMQLESLDSIVVVLDEATYNAGLVKFESAKIKTCIGGRSRAESVCNGLQDLHAAGRTSDMVLVHDAARPCVRVSDIKRLVDEVAGDDNGGLLAMPVVDTIKRVGSINTDDTDNSGDVGLRVTENVDRNQLWRAATPQLFPCELLLQSLKRALDEGADITDEASAMQHAGYRPRVIECSADNIKATTPTDLALVQHYLSIQQAEQSNA